MTSRVRWLAIGGLVLAACRAPGSTAGGALRQVEPQPEPIQTSMRAYSMEPMGMGNRLTIVATFRNRSTAPIYLERCGSDGPTYALEKQAGDQWASAAAPVCQLIGAAPIVVPPGESRTDTLRLLDLSAPNAAPRFQIHPIRGTYRLVYDAFARIVEEPPITRPTDRLPIEARVSNRFEVTQ
jgi:hypothetical protein